MTEIHCTGTSYEIGFAHGSQAQLQVKSCIENYTNFFATLNPPITWGAASVLAKKFLSTMVKIFPESIDEIKGIADGAGVRFEDILILNCRSEIGLTELVVDGCSALSYGSRKGEQWLGQNWDWHPNQRKNILILHITPITGPRIITLTEAGIVGKVGFNSVGVGVTLNGIKTGGINLAFDKPPIHLALRYAVLSSQSVTQAIEKLKDYGGIASTAHFLVSSSTDSFGVEISPFGLGVIPPDRQGFIYHTNHWYTSPQLVHYVPWLEDTFARLGRLRFLGPKSLLNSSDVAQHFWEILGDDDGGKGGICRGPAEEEGQLETLFGVVMDLKAKKAEIVVGRPVQGVHHKQVQFTQSE